MNFNEFLYYKNSDTNPFMDRISRIMIKHLDKSQEPWTIAYEDQPFEPEIKEFLACLSLDPWWPVENEELPKEIEGMISKEESHESEDYIEDWFQKVTTPQHSSILQKILTPNPKVKLVSNILVNIEV